MYKRFLLDRNCTYEKLTALRLPLNGKMIIAELPAASFCNKDHVLSDSDVASDLACPRLELLQWLCKQNPVNMHALHGCRLCFV